jgi:putative ABC transport system permease protein
VHLALGAPRGRVLAVVLGSSLRAIAAGAALGALVVFIGGLAASRAIAPMLMGVGPLDPIALGAATVFLAAITLSAAYVPARRALAIGPMQALRRG